MIPQAKHSNSINPTNEYITYISLVKNKYQYTSDTNETYITGNLRRYLSIGKVSITGYQWYMNDKYS